jgi:peptidylprolyl isomerase
LVTSGASGTSFARSFILLSVLKARLGFCLPIVAGLLIAGCGYPDPYQGQAGDLAAVPATTPTPLPGHDQFSDGAKQALTKFPDGLQYTDIKVGSGPVAEHGDQAQVNYTLFFTDGTVVEASRASGHTFQLTVDASAPGAPVKGFVEGVQGMRVGGRRRVVIPPGLAYGDQGQPPKIPPKTTLIFIIELVSVGAPTPTPSAAPS